MQHFLEIFCYRNGTLKVFTKKRSDFRAPRFKKLKTKFGVMTGNTHSHTNKSLWGRGSDFVFNVLCMIVIVRLIVILSIRYYSTFVTD